MGNNQSVNYMRGAVKLEHYHREADLQHQVAGQAFDKCVTQDHLTDRRIKLSPEEQRCISEYGRLYAQYARSAYRSFSQHYTLHEHQMMMRAQQEQMGGR
uniref:Uncharacterized protein n=1 Tax=Neobodo designis TaxID=312471 RepID=A0A7S1R493_NEODS|mmetsp:Transcript_7589/g.23675  ORF Transcript_7589/g.23675 Transcript_7589/m.23675 type:complete len:100 (+) Transcript_7589:54-353(+)